MATGIKVIRVHGSRTMSLPNTSERNSYSHFCTSPQFKLVKVILARSILAVRTLLSEGVSNNRLTRMDNDPDDGEQLDRTERIRTLGWLFYPREHSDTSPFKAQTRLRSPIAFIFGRRGIRRGRGVRLWLRFDGILRACRRGRGCGF
jgi:hypothetical protein